MEGGQREVKQNLVKFNNFVREKQGKVEGGLERANVEVVLQVMYLSLANQTLENSSPVSCVSLGPCFVCCKSTHPIKPPRY